MWKRIGVIGIPPPPGSGGTATLVKNEMWLYGGENQYNTSKGFGKRRDVHGGIHVLNLDTWEWRGIKAIGSISTKSLLPMPLRVNWDCSTEDVLFLFLHSF